MSISIIANVFELPLQGPQKAVLLALADFANPVDGYAWPSQATLAYRAGYGERCIRTHLAALEDAGWIRRVSATPGSGHCSYYLNLPRIEDEAATVVAERRSRQRQDAEQARLFRESHAFPKPVRAASEDSAGEPRSADPSRDPAYEPPNEPTEEPAAARASACVDEATAAATRRCADLWLSATGTTMAPLVWELMEAAIEATSEEWVADAIRETGANGARAWKYTAAILDRWQREGRATKAADPATDLEARKRKFGVV